MKRSRRPGLRELVKKFAEIRRLELLEPAAAILGRIIPAVRRCADKRARQGTVAVINPVVSDDFVDDGWQFASGASAFKLQAMFGVIEVVENGFEHTKEHDVDVAGLLDMRQPGERFAGVQSICAS